MEKKFQKMNLAYYNLLIAPVLSQAHSQILSIIILRESMKLNVNTKTMIRKNAKLAELDISIVIVFLNVQTLQII